MSTQHTQHIMVKKSTLSLKPAILIICTAAYREGKLHGKWVDVDSADNLLIKINELLETSPIPNSQDWEIHRSVGFPFPVYRYEDMWSVLALGNLILDYGDAFVNFIRHHNDPCGYSLETVEESFIEAYQGEFVNTHRFARKYLLQDRGMAGQFSKYVDWSLVVRELFPNQYYCVPSTKGVYVFKAIDWQGLKH